jgi:hypothetical protein
MEYTVHIYPLVLRCTANSDRVQEYRHPMGLESIVLLLVLDIDL